MNPFEPHGNSIRSDFPPGDGPFAAEQLDKPRFRFIGGIVVIVVIVGLVVVPLTFFALRGEVSRWRIASAEEKRLNGDIQGAILDLDRAIQETPNDVQLLRKRAQWRLEQESFTAALDDCNRISELQPGDPLVYMLRSEVLQHLGRHEEAVADWKQIMALPFAQSPAGRPGALNGLAYYRGLANMEIDEALSDIDEALRRSGENYAMLDTRGYLYYRQMDFDRALGDLNRAVANAEEEYEEWRVRSVERGFGLPDRREQVIDARRRAQIFAVIVFHRGLVHQARGDDELAARDFQRVKELGFEPDDRLF